MLAATLCAVSTQAQSLDAPLTFGVVPQLAASELARRWTPVLAYLSEKTGVSIRFGTAPNIPTFERRLAAGEYDLAYMNPYHYTVFHRKPGYQALAKEKDKRIQGILVVRKDSAYRQLEDLRGQTLVFPSPAAFAASVLPRASLAKQGIAFKAKYVASHDSVYLAVAKGLYTAGGGIVRTLAAVEPAVRDQLRVLWQTEQYTPHAIAAHPRLPQAFIERVQQALVMLDQIPAGRDWLTALNFKGFVAARDADWNDVRALNITPLESLIEQ
ncbi:MAG: phosphate/phosphite/phosphonate ABC transporter substrate-binding protein [Candidatus Competibacteraceae bacterium]